MTKFVTKSTLLLALFGFSVRSAGFVPAEQLMTPDELDLTRDVSQEDHPPFLRKSNSSAAAAAVAIPEQRQLALTSCYPGLEGTVNLPRRSRIGSERSATSACLCELCVAVSVDCWMESDGGGRASWALQDARVMETENGDKACVCAWGKLNKVQRRKGMGHAACRCCEDVSGGNGN